jgi:hypothetical protein
MQRRTSAGADASVVGRLAPSTFESESTSKATQAVVPILAELALIGLPAVFVIMVVSAVLASRQQFIGFFGDVQHFMWLTNTFKDVLSTGDPMIKREFFGVPTPYAYNPIVMLEVIASLLVLETSGNPFFSYNFLLLGFLLLNFCSMYLVLRLLRFGAVISFVFAAVFLFAPATMAHATGHVYFVVTFLLPLYLYCLYRLKQQPQKIAYWLGLAVISGAYLWVREELGLFIILTSALALAVNARSTLHGRLFPHLGLWLAVVGLFALPILALHLQKRHYDHDHGVHTTRDIQEAQLYSSSPANYLFPSDESLIYRHLPVVFKHANKAEHLNYLGLINLAGLGAWLFMLVFRRDLLDSLLRGAPFLRALQWELTLMAAASLILSLGPVLKLNDSDLNLPVHGLYDLGLPIVDQLRAWGRFGIFSFGAATLLSVHVFRFLLTKYGTAARPLLPLLAIPALLLVTFDQYPWGTIYRHKFEVPPAVHEIKATPGDFFVLDLPLNIYSGALNNATAQLLQVYHGKRIVNGYSPFVHRPFEQRVLNSPLVCFNYPQMIDTPSDECRASTISKFFTDEDIGYVVYEKITWGYQPGFGPQEDAVLREKSLRILNQLTDMGALEVSYDDASYTFYRRSSRPP